LEAGARSNANSKVEGLVPIANLISNQLNIPVGNWRKGYLLSYLLGVSREKEAWRGYKQTGKKNIRVNKNCSRIKKKRKRKTGKEQRFLSWPQFNGISTVSPTSSSAESSNDTLLIDFSFSTGGGAGTSMLDGAITAGCRLEPEVSS
jgi:hypothetical protein